MLRRRNKCAHNEMWRAPTILVSRLGESATDRLTVEWVDSETCRWCSSCSAAAEAQYDASTRTFTNCDIPVALLRQGESPQRSHSSSGRAVRSRTRRGKSHVVNASSSDALSTFVMKAAQAGFGFDNLGGFRFWLSDASPEPRWSTVHEHHTATLATLGIRAGVTICCKMVRRSRSRLSLALSLARALSLSRSLSFRLISSPQHPRATALLPRSHARARAHVCCRWR